MRYRLIKVRSTSTFGIDRMIDKTTVVERRIRNFQARNFMRDQMKVGDTSLILHPPSSALRRPRRSERLSLSN